MLDAIENHLGGWPLMNSSWGKNDKEDLLVKLLRFHKIGYRPLFEFYVGPDPKIAHAHILNVN
jgi:hypothetical protein